MRDEDVNFCGAVLLERLSGRHCSHTAVDHVVYENRNLEGRDVSADDVLKTNMRCPDRLLTFPWTSPTRI